MKCPQLWKYIIENCFEKKSQNGFTLVELLVVIIILGILSVIALPSFLGQVGKARNLEFANAVGTINRAQQAYHWEKQVFAHGSTIEETMEQLNISIKSKYIDDYIFNISSTEATIELVNNDFSIDGTRGHSGAVFFDNGQYFTIVCQSRDPFAQIDPPLALDDCGVHDRLR